MVTAKVRLTNAYRLRKEKVPDARDERSSSPYAEYADANQQERNGCHHRAEDLTATGVAVNDSLITSRK